MSGDIGSRIIKTFGYVITHQGDQLIKPFLRHTNEISLSKFVILNQDILFYSTTLFLRRRRLLLKTISMTAKR